MIIEGLFNLIYSLLDIVLTPFQIIPDMPVTVTQFLNIFKNFLIAPINVLCFFINVNYLKTLIVLFIGVLNMEHIWDGILWVLKKLPFVGIE